MESDHSPKRDRIWPHEVPAHYSCTPNPSRQGSVSPQALPKDLAMTAPVGPDFFQQVDVVIAYFAPY